MPVKRRKSKRRDSDLEQFRDLVRRYLSGDDTLTRAERLRVLTSTVQLGRMTLDRWAVELGEDVGRNDN